MLNIGKKDRLRIVILICIIFFSFLLTIILQENDNYRFNIKAENDYSTINKKD